MNSRDELIGKELKVVGSKNKSLMGMSGEVIDETKETIIVETAKGRKQLLKKGSIFTINEKTFQGEKLVGRSEERLKK